MPRNRDRPQDRNANGRPFTAQDANANIPQHDARLFAMHESLIQSYTHFAYHANHMYHLLSQSLHGTQNSINAHPYPWLQSPAQVPVPVPHVSDTRPPPGLPSQPKIGRPFPMNARSLLLGRAGGSGVVVQATQPGVAGASVLELVQRSYKITGTRDN